MRPWRGLLLVAALAGPAPAQDAAGAGPRVEVGLDPAGPVTVGTPLTLTVTLLVPTWMPQPPVWPDFQIADAITRLPPDASRSTSERIGGETWSGVRRAYRIVPQAAADFTLPAAEIAVTYADPGSSAPLTAQVAVPEVEFSAVIPPAAAGLDPFVAASGLTLDASTGGLPATPAPGDALTLTLTATATGTEAMLLPPLLAGVAVPAGLRAYPKAPLLTDTPGERGGPATARRVETVTYVVEAPGDYTLAGLSLGWWNVASGAVETAATAPVRFTVAAPPGWKPPGAAPERGRWWPWLAGAAVAALALAVLPRLWRRARRAYAASEPRAFRRLRQIVRAGEVGAIRPALGAWLSVAGVSGPTPAALDRALVALERQRFGPPDGAAAPGPDALLQALRLQRSRLRHEGRTVDAAPLPPLNPAMRGEPAAAESG